MTMLDTYIPFDQGPGATATAPRWRQMARNFCGSGVIPGYLNQMTPTLAGTNLTIASGGVMCDGMYGENAGPKTFAVSAAGIAVARMDPTARSISFAWLANATTYTQNLTGIFEVPIAMVVNSALVDFREWATGGGGVGGSHSEGMIGEIRGFAYSTPLPGWIVSDGRYLDRAQYPELFAKIGVVYGSTSATNFRIPELTARVPFGASANYAMGTWGGSATVTLTTAQMPTHNHGNTGNISANHVHRNTVPTSGTNGATIISWSASTIHIAYSPSGEPVTIDSSGTQTSQIESANHVHATANAGSSNSHENMPPYMVITWMIKVR